MFKKSTQSSKDVIKKPEWKILIVDDEPEVHSITKVVLKGFEFEEKGIQLLSAYSGSEARALLEEHSDIALIYLDVVMETDDAGLQLVKYIREDIANQFVRIILRTGQPGHAPEREVIVNYDINDYKEKTHFDSGKLFTSTYSGLRAFQDIMNVEESRKKLDRYRLGLEKVIHSTSNLFELRSLQQFAKGLLIQLGSLLRIDQDMFLVRCHGMAVTHEQGKFQVLADARIADTGAVLEEPPEHIKTFLEKACERESTLFEGDVFVGYFPSKSGQINLLYLDGVHSLDDLDRKLIEVFSSNVTVAFDNLYLDKELFETQTEIIDTLGDVVESRSNEAANHVRRVAHYSKLLAELIGLEKDECDAIFMAAPMHDIGKVAIPDRVLLKPDKLNDEEWEIMKTHAQVGSDIFSKSKRSVLKAASIIAGQHHEKYDGTGYPNGLTGDEIHIYARIVTLADVFDALVHKRCYKRAWPLTEVVEYIENEKGKHFDPELVELLFQHMDSMKKILNDFKDEE